MQNKGKQDIYSRITAPAPPLLRNSSTPGSR